MRLKFPQGVAFGGQIVGVDWAKDETFFAEAFDLGGRRIEFPMLDRSWYWLASSIHLVFPPLLDTSSSSEDFPIKYVATKFNPALPINFKLPPGFKRGQGGTTEWTQEQRELVGQALRPATFEEFDTIMNKTLSQGYARENRYVYLPASATAHHDIMVHGPSHLQSNMICLVLSLDTLSDHLKDLLFVYSQLLFKLKLQDVDTKALGSLHKWFAYHLGVWNRYAWTAKNHPGSDVLRDRAAGQTQSQPYYDRSVSLLASTGGDENSSHDPYEVFSDVICQVLAPALRKLEHYIPELLKEHSRLFSSLDPSFNLGGAPFCMTVVNVQPVTDGHRDSEDKVDSFCLILALGKFTGGELCLWEIPLWLQLEGEGISEDLMDEGLDCLAWLFISFEESISALEET
ncbi:hypothetical protein FS749_004192 [Ceratobasidium sp. UAMH 11750]|nr:hypothetical protein FS749_004192 [Ceratobasidium sp. UAMH 11750]